jgi:hypothetical protein
MWDLRWTKQHWDRCPPSTSVYPAKRSTDSSTLIIHLHRDEYNRPVIASVIVDAVVIQRERKEEAVYGLMT